MLKTTEKQHVNLLSSTSIEGTNVVNSQGEDLGSVEDLMIDLQSGRISYAVLSFGGVLGLGDKLFAVPWQAFTVDQENEELILNVDQQSLKNAPGFDKDNWPQTAEHSWLTGVYDYYGHDYSNFRS